MLYFPGATSTPRQCSAGTWGPLTTRPDQWTSVIFDNGLNITTLELGMVECVSGLVDGSISVPTFVYGRLGDDGPVVFYAEDGSDFPEQG